VAENGTTAFLQQAYRNNWQQYLRLLSPEADVGWDLCVLTASDERQAEMYRRQLELRRASGALPSRTRFLIIPDPPGQRIGPARTADRFRWGNAACALAALRR